MRRNFRILFVATAMIAASAFAVAASIYSGPSTEQLASDIDAISAEIRTVESEANRYESGSVIRFQIDLRLKTLATTKSMLEQKKLSLIRGIDLKFTQDGREITPVDPSTLKSIDDEIAAANAAADAAKAKAAQYAPSLVQSMALVEEATYRASVAISRERRAILMLGYALPPSTAAGSGLPSPTLPPAPAPAQTIQQTPLAEASANKEKIETEPEASGPAWVVIDSKSPLDDSQQVTAFITSEDGNTHFYMRCKEHKTDLLISTQEYVGSDDVKIIYRVGDSKPITSTWDSSTNGRAAFAKSPIELAKRLTNDTPLFVRIFTYRSSVDARFNLANVETARNKVAAACKWPVASQNDVKSSEQQKPTQKPPMNLKP